MLSQDGVYRYLLTRKWGSVVDNGAATFVMLNPSTADATTDDPTIRRCIGFAKAWGLSGLIVVNLYALRSTDPRALRAHADPIGPDNGLYLGDVLDAAAHRGTPVVAAWGAHADPAHARTFARMASARGVELQCLGRTKAGAPRHPLYIAAATALQPWSPFGGDAR
jgi:hypothetical protein